MLALAQALVARGHAPIVAAPPNVEAWVRSLGFQFAPLGRDIQVFLDENRDIMTGKPIKMFQAMSRYFNDQIPHHAQQLKTACENADAVVYGGLAFIARSVAEHLRLPEFGVFYSSCLLPSSQHPPPNIPWHGMPNWMNDLFWRANYLASDVLMRKTINTVRAGLGLAPIDHISFE